MNPIKILIADDIEIIAKTIKSKIEKIEYVEIVGIAKDGEEEFEKIIELNPDLVVTDNKMPKMTGIEVIEKIKNLNIINKPDFILVTGNVDMSIREKVKELKIYGVVEKSASYDKLIEKVEEYKLMPKQEEKLQENNIMPKKNKQGILKTILKRIFCNM